MADKFCTEDGVKSCHGVAMVQMHCEECDRQVDEDSPGYDDAWGFPRPCSYCMKMLTKNCLKEATTHCDDIFIICQDCDDASGDVSPITFIINNMFKAISDREEKIESLEEKLKGVEKA